MEPVVWIAAGLAAGLVSGLLGVGGGIVLTPFLHYVVGRPWTEAVALSLAVIAVQSPIGVWRHRARGSVDWRLGGGLAIGGLGGVWLGDRLLPHLPVPVLKLFFAILMGIAAWRLAAHIPEARFRAALPAVLGLGFAAGIVSRLLGVGGGIVTVPLLSLLGVPVHLAVGSSLVPVFSNAALATGANLARGLAWQDGALLAAGAVVGSLAGVRAAHALPERGLRRVVAAALLVVGLLVAIEAVRNLL